MLYRRLYNKSWNKIYREFVQDLAESLEGSTGAEIKHVCQEAILNSLGDQIEKDATEPKVSMRHFQASVSMSKRRLSRVSLKQYEYWASSRKILKASTL